MNASKPDTESDARTAPPGDRVLVIQTAFVGDLLLCIPLLKRVRRLRPGSHLTVLCRQGLGDFLRRSGLADEVVEADKKSGTSWRAARRKLVQIRWDWVICPHESWRSALLVRKLNAKLKTGFARFWNGLVFHERPARPMDLPDALRQMSLLIPHDPELEKNIQEYRAKAKLRPMHRLMEVPPWAAMDVESLRQMRASKGGGMTEKTRALLAAIKAAPERSRLAVLAPGSVWATKMWRAEGFVEVGRILAQKGWQVVLLGTQAERPVCERIQAQIPEAKVLAGETDLWQGAELLAVADLLICNDSGAMHMGALSGVPTVAVFGPTTLDLGYRPWQNSARVVEADLPCRPCGKHGARKCPLGTHDCMKKVTGSMVLRAIQDL